jgi:restriction system protein
MAIPATGSLYLPVLEAYGSEELRTGQLIARVADRLQLSEEERVQRVQSDTKTKFASNVSFAKADLLRAGLVRDVGLGFFAITNLGREVLSENPSAIDRVFLRQFPGFADFERQSRARRKKRNSPKKEAHADVPSEEARLHQARRQAEEALVDTLLARMRRVTVAKFEELMVALLRRAGYGGHLKDAGIVLGRAGDNGVDGVVKLDLFGLDCVYMQARRYATGRKVSSGEIRDFFGALDREKASKGIFFTTSQFSPSAIATAQQLSKRIELVDGLRLARLMIDLDVGIKIKETFNVKCLDDEILL